MFFHIHIPKTGGTSLNHMLANALGDKFQDHGLSIEAPSPSKPFAAAHRTFLQAQRIVPGRRLATIVREPTEHIHSLIRHLYMRKHLPQYADKSALICSLIDSGFVLSPTVANDELFLINFDNIMVRYLTGAPIVGRVKNSDLSNAIQNLKNMEFVGRTDRLSDLASQIFSAFSLPMPEILHDNKAATTQRFFEKTPESIVPYIEHDIQLYDYIVRSY